MVTRGGLFGSFLLFAAFALLLVATISSPIFRQITFLDVYTNGDHLTFGVFGYCTSTTCTPRQLGYNLPGVTSELGFQGWSNDAIVGLTKALILHPIAAGLAFFAFLVALFSDRLGYLFSAFIALIAFLVSLAAMAIDFAIFTIAREQINRNTTFAVSSKFGNAIWLVLAATIILFFATFAVCFSCCTARRKERYAGNGGRYY